MKLATSFGNGADSTFFAALSGAVSDMAGTCSRRSLVGFDLESAGDYNITLRFDEPVASNTLDGSAWYLQRKSTSTHGYVELKGLGAPVVAARTLVAGVSAATRSALASDSSLGTSQSSSYLRPISRSPSTIGVESLTLDASTGVAELYADACEPLVRLTLADGDVEDLRYMTSLTRGNASTYLVAAATTANDEDAGDEIAANALEEIATSDGLRAAAVYGDVTPPRFVSCDLDLDAAELTLTFDEPVRAASFDATRVQLRDAYDEADATSAVTLTTNSAPSADAHAVVALDGLDTPKINLDLDENDIVLEFDEPVNVSSVEPVERSLLLSSGQSLCQSADATALALGCSTVAASSSTYNETVRVSLCADDTDALMALGGLCRSESSCYLSHGYALAEDAAAPPNVARSLAVEYALEASAILPDVTPPTLIALGGEGLSLDAASTYLSLAAGLVDDVNGNTAVDVFEYSAFGPAANWTRDSTPPRLLAFSKVSKTKKIMYLLFDEPVDHEAANLSLIAIADSEDGAETLYLDGADLAVEVLDPAEEDNAEAPADALAPYSTTLSIYLGNAYATLPISDQDSTYVKLDDGAVATPRRNPNAPRRRHGRGRLRGHGGARCTQLGPALEAFALDMDAPATLTLQFTDGVVANASGWTSTTATASALLSETDAWKLQRAGQGLAKKSGATFISTTANLGTLDSDTSRVGDPNSVVATANDRAVALSASTFDRDATAPSLTNYTLDLDSGLLELHFDEPVKYRELNLSSLAQDGPGPALHGREFEDSSTVLLSDPRASTTPATTPRATRARPARTRAPLGPRPTTSRRRGRVDGRGPHGGGGRVGNRVAKTEDATSSPSIPVGALVKDARAPELEAFSLDLDGDGFLYLNFSEPVNPQSLNVTRITLRSSPQVSAAPITHPSSPPSPLLGGADGDAVGDAVRGPLDAPDVRAVEPADALPDLRHAVAHGGPRARAVAEPDDDRGAHGRPWCRRRAPSPTPTPADVRADVAAERPAVAGADARHGVRAQARDDLPDVPRRQGADDPPAADLASLKQTIASNPFIDGIGQSVDSTFLEATVGYVTDMAFPGASNDAPAVFSLQAAEIRMDTTGPRLAGYDYLEGTAVYLYFNEPLSGTGFNVSTLLFRADANATAAPVKLTDSTMLLDNDCVVKIAVTSAASDDVVGGVAALEGLGPGDVSDDYGHYYDGVLNGLLPGWALPDGPCATLQILDMSENKLYIRYYHDVDADNINVTAVVVAASDSADAWSYRLTNATSEMYVAYDGKGEGVVQINLGAADLGGVKTFQMVPDNANPTVTRCDVDMDLGVLTIELDEPVRASEAEVTYITVSQTAAGGASFTLTSATAPRETGASATLTLDLGDADLDELKRLDHLAMNASTTHVSWLSYTLLDRGALANPLLESGEGMRVASYVADETDPVLGSYDVDLQARTMTLHFDEPVRVASFNASCLRLQESTLADEGQSYALFDSYAVDDSGADAVSVLDLDVEVGDDDYDAINDLSRLAKDIDSLRLLLRFSVDMDRGTLTLNFTETVRFGSLDATKLEFYSTDDVDGGGDAVALSDSTTEASLEQFDDAYSTDDDAWYDTRYHGAANVFADAERRGPRRAKASAIATDRSTTFLSAEEGAVTDMTGNDLAATTTRKPCAGYAADATQPQLASFDLDMDAGTLDLEFSEAVDVGTLTFELLALSTDGYATGGVVLTAAEATATRGDGKLAAQVALDLGDANVDALKVARVGTDGDSAWLAAAAGAVDDMDGLPLVRIAPLDVSGGAPLQASRVVADDTVPVLLRVGFDAPDLILLYDEPVDIDTVQPNKLRIVTPEGLGDNLNEALAAAYGASNEELVIDISAQCGQPATCDLFYNATNVTNATMLRIEASSPLIEVAVAELQRIGPTLVASGADLHDVVCSLKECDLAKAYVIDKYDSNVAAAGFVKDFAANSADNSGVVALTDPECACASGTYITTPCTSRADAVCATCSTACQADYDIVSECGEYVDVGCEPCVSCGYPYYDAGGCSGSSDRVCSPCTECTAMEYESSPCEAGADRVCVSCARSSRRADGAVRERRAVVAPGQLLRGRRRRPGPCNEQTESDVRIGKRNSRQPLFDAPEVEEGYEQGDATTL
ncbi:hypothetical protein JL721_12576 [Aureococcus anophagefferens]|nr:hypothetical protein JL721_12576 [Aureococcus anophagefferens]